MKAKVYVTLKKSVLDPQGKTVQSALSTMGFKAVDEVRCGKFIELAFGEGTQKTEAEGQLKEMCEQLLANTVIEDYRWELVT